MDVKGKFWQSSQRSDGWWELPWGHMDVLEEASKPVHQGHTQRTQDGVPVGLHVLRGTSLGVTLAAKIISAWCHDVRDEIIISTRCLGKRNKNVSRNNWCRSTAVDLGRWNLGGTGKEKMSDDERLAQYDYESIIRKTGNHSISQALTRGHTTKIWFQMLNWSVYVSELHQQRF